jgi:cysteine desulfurase
LDANASMPPLENARVALLQATGDFQNPSSPHAMGRAARKKIDGVRVNVAAALGGDEKETFFTSGATEGNRWMLQAAILAGTQRKRPLRVFSSLLEHPSLAKPLEQAAAAGAIDHAFIPISNTGDLILNPEQFENADLVFCTAAHNETGLIPNHEQLSKTLPDATILSMDAAQAVGRLPLLPERVDAIIASAHKLGGYPGTGAVLLRNRGRKLPAPWTGGGQENGLRPGTEAYPLLLAFGAAAAAVDKTREAHSNLARLRDRLETEISRELAGVHFVGQNRNRLPNTSAIFVDGVDGEALRMATDMAGLCVGFGSACSALAPEPSPALLALGLTRAQARATMRISFYPETTIETVDRCIKEIRLLIRQLRKDQ